MSYTAPWRMYERFVSVCKNARIGCIKPKCTFAHSLSEFRIRAKRICRYGEYCRINTCKFIHPDQMELEKLKAFQESWNFILANTDIDWKDPSSNTEKRDSKEEKNVDKFSFDYYNTSSKRLISEYVCVVCKNNWCERCDGCPLCSVTRSDCDCSEKINEWKCKTCDEAYHCANCKECIQCEDCKCPDDVDLFSEKDDKEQSTMNDCSNNGREGRECCDVEDDIFAYEILKNNEDINAITENSFFSS
jgi:hypothetical protein